MSITCFLQCRNHGSSEEVVHVCNVQITICFKEMVFYLWDSSKMCYSKWCFMYLLIPSLFPRHTHQHLLIKQCYCLLILLTFFKVICSCIFLGIEEIWFSLASRPFDAWRDFYYFIIPVRWLCFKEFQFSLQLSVHRSSTAKISEYLSS